jgi:hypothetical protein
MIGSRSTRSHSITSPYGSRNKALSHGNRLGAPAALFLQVVDSIATMIHTLVIAALEFLSLSSS